MYELAGERMALVDQVVPGEGIRRDAILVAAGALLVALCARIEIPLYPVPITGQTFGVLLVAALLGANRGAFGMVTYLAVGALGVPVFASGKAGIVALAGPTAGYLYGFVFAAYVVGYLCQAGWDRRFISAASAMVIGTTVIYVSGVLWLSQFVGWDRVLAVGVQPFILGAVLKIGLATVLLPPGRRIVGAGDFGRA